MSSDIDNMIDKLEENECLTCKYYDEEDNYCTAFICDGISCPDLPCEVENPDNQKF